MSLSIHHRIKVLIEETNDAFSSCDSGTNADYPEFAALAINQFKNVLAKPDLTPHELTTMLRKAQIKHRDVDPDSCWSTFMAYYISKTSNSDSRAKTNAVV